MFNSKDKNTNPEHRHWFQALVRIFFLTLPFFQPGLLWLSTLYVWIHVWRKAQSKGFFKGLGAALLYIPAYAGLCIFVLPFVHTLTVLSWHTVLIWGSVLIASGVSWVTATHAKMQEWNPRMRHLSHGVIWTLAIVVGASSWFANSEKDLYEWSMAESLEPQQMDRLPDSDLSNYRLLPKARAQDYLRAINNDTTLRVSEAHITPCDNTGKQCWEAAFHLKGKEDQILYNVLFDTVFNVATVDPTNPNMQGKKAEGHNAFFLAGPHSWPIEAAFAVHNPFSTQEDALYWEDEDGVAVMLIPYVSLKPTLTGAMVPYLAGVLEVNRFGLISDLSPSTAAERYRNVPFFPTKLAREYADIYAKWHGGIWGRTVSKRNELKVSEPAEIDPHYNPAPYVDVYSGMGWQEVVALEPFAEDSRALSELLFFDAGSGKCRKYVVPTGTILNGPRQAMANSMQGDWEADWSNHLKVEPRPLIWNGKIYYTIGILAKEGTEHPYMRSIVINGADMTPYPVLNQPDLLDLMSRLDRGEKIEPFKFSTLKNATPIH